MKIYHKYLRNRCYKNKYWKRVRSKEHPYKTLCPFFSPWYSRSYEDQIKDNFEDITKRARAMENGVHKGYFHATAEFRRLINRDRKAKERNALAKLRQGDYDVELPKFKRDADWLYF